MFSLFKKKKKNINTDEITNFNNILKVIEDFILFEDFDKASKAINEIIEKENESFKNYIDQVEEKNKKPELERFKKKIELLQKLKDKNDLKKRKYEKIRIERKKKEEMKFVKNRVIELSGGGNFDEAISLLNSLLEKNLNEPDVINLVNDLKKIINKQIEKFKIKKEKEIRKDALTEAHELIGEIKSNSDENAQTSDKLNIFQQIKYKLNFYGNFKKRLSDKRLLDEVNLLLQTHNDKNELIAKSKLDQIHSGISREIYGEKINGYDLYGKIMGADKISGDSLGFHKGKNDYSFFIGDATGHGIRAGFIISQMTKKFHEIVGSGKMENIIMEINNSLKQEIKSGNFITSIFFNINKNTPDKVEFIGMGHEPMFIFRKKTGTVEKIIPGGLAAGIRIIKDLQSIKKKTINFEDGDILVSYTDGIVEAKSEENKMYSIDRISKKLEEYGRNQKMTLEDIYTKFIDDLRSFTGGKVNYNDDVTLLLLKRDKNKEILNQEEIVEKIIQKEGLDKKYKNKIMGKSLEEIRDEIMRIQKENALKNIIKSLDILYKTGELPKLKQDCIRYIKEGYIHKKINNYLKKALDNENAFKINQKDKKVHDKYNILYELYKKGDYQTVISECSNIISKDGNI